VWKDRFRWELGSSLRERQEGKAKEEKGQSTDHHAMLLRITLLH
jgi:hypothetical protein